MLLPCNKSDSIRCSKLTNNWNIVLEAWSLLYLDSFERSCISRYQHKQLCKNSHIFYLTCKTKVVAYNSLLISTSDVTAFPSVVWSSRSCQGNPVVKFRWVNKCCTHDLVTAYKVYQHSCVAFCGLISHLLYHLMFVVLSPLSEDYFWAFFHNS